MLAKSLIVLCVTTFYVTDATLTWTGGTTLSLAEDQATSATVGTYTVAGGTGAITYSLLAGSPPFTIDSGTGALSLSTALDFETESSHSVEIKALDSTTGTALSATTTVTVTVTDVDVAPVFTSSSYSRCLTDGTAAGTSVITVTATDADAGNTISYAITGGNTGTPFTATASSGLIQVTSGVTLSTTTPSYALKVTATNTGSTVRSATVTVSITVADACNSATTTIVSMLLLPVAVFVTLF